MDLSSQATPTAQDQIDLQHAIWNVFDPAVFVPDDSFINGVLADEAGGIDGFNFNNYQFLEAIPADGSRAQAFVLYSPVNNEEPQAAPEPGGTLLSTIGLSSIGLGLIGISRLCRIKLCAVKP